VRASRAAERRLDPGRAARPRAHPVARRRAGEPRWCDRGIDLVDRLPDRHGRSGVGEHPVRARSRTSRSTCSTRRCTRAPTG
jgi:hypothetical protein